MNLKQLSQHLGLSQTTVSRALNGYPEVSEETRRRVADAASAFDYRPNASARRLALGRTGMIGLTYPLGRGMPIDPLFAEFLAGLADSIVESDSDLMIIPLRGTGPSAPRLSHLRSVDAVIISAPGLDDPLIPLLETLKLPFVLHGRTNSSHAYAYLDIDNEGGFRRATELLLDLGHSRIGLINCNTWHTFAAHRELGWQAAMRGRGLEAPPELTRQGPMTEEIGYRCARDLLTGDLPPTALICSSVLQAVGASRAITDQDLVVGRDVSLVAHDDGMPSIRPDTISPALTTTFSSLRKAGAHIAHIAQELGRGAPATDFQEVWPVEIVFRGSAQPVRAT